MSIDLKKIKVQTVCKCGCNNTQESEKGNCPVCTASAQRVTNITVKNFLKKELRTNIKQDDIFFLCLNKDCDVSSFNTSDNSFFHVNDIIKPLWYKTKTTEKIACYCNNITFEQVKEQVLLHNKTNWKDIVESYKKKAICACDKLNPTGNCCTEVFYDIINKTLIEAGKNPVEIKECCE